MLTQSCETLTGVGPTIAMLLKQCNIYSIQDLLFHLPYRYQDRTRITPIRDLRANDWSVISGQICKTEVKPGKRSTFVCSIDDKTGLFALRFFNFNTHHIQSLKVGRLIRAFGEVREFSNTLSMIHPDYQLLDSEGICCVEETLTPIYSTTQGLSQARLRQLIKRVLTEHQKELDEMEWMTNEERHRQGFHPIRLAIEQLHHPSPETSLHSLEEGHHPALRRLVFDELLAEHLSMRFARLQRASLIARALPPQTPLIEQFLSRLPFRLTSAQHRVFNDIHHDLIQHKPMLRLVQGDVGSGKTVIAALAALQAIGNGCQVAFMAPTDILSEQHAHTLQRWFEPLNIRIDRLSGKMGAKARKKTLEALSNHDCQLVIGTHALFQANVSYACLGLVIIDEQHRFGVAQRLLLQQKGHQDQYCPHQLLMTATPIPRTLAMTQFAHLDVSSIDELPPGRTPITTAVLNQNKRDDLIGRVQHAIERGRQAYWVCTLIDESETRQCQAATVRAEQLRLQLPTLRVGLIHGRMKASEKEETMAAFKQGDIQILVATTVIEVGVDVANASLMIIENAERLGLSQLHQLRGRVGRGSAQSHCLLLYQAPLSQHSHERLRIMRETCDGFLIAEKDLELRGSGEVLGTRQTGYRSFKVANLPRDKALLPLLANTATRLLRHDPELAQVIAERWLGRVEQYLQG